jgi:hypothetical protein
MDSLIIALVVVAVLLPTALLIGGFVWLYRTRHDRSEPTVIYVASRRR